MPTLNRRLNVIVRCAALYREKALAGVLRGMELPKSKRTISERF